MLILTFFIDNRFILSIMLFYYDVPVHRNKKSATKRFPQNGRFFLAMVAQPQLRHCFLSDMNP